MEVSTSGNKEQLQGTLATSLGKGTGILMGALSKTTYCWISLDRHLLHKQLYRYQNRVLYQALGIDA